MASAKSLIAAGVLAMPCVDALVHCSDPAEEDISFKKNSQRDSTFSSTGARGHSIIQLISSFWRVECKRCTISGGLL